MKQKHVRCKSGNWGWQCHLQDNYANFEEFKSYAETRYLHTRLGFKTIAGAWRSNPLVQGSVIPSDFCRIKESVKKV